MDQYSNNNTSYRVNEHVGWCQVRGQLTEGLKLQWGLGIPPIHEVLLLRYERKVNKKE
jgi:hypothetical protein